MGTAVTGMNEEEGAASPPAKRESNGSEGAADTASACHSFWEVEGTGAGVKGVKGCAGFVQHVGVGHFEQSDSQHLQATRGVAEPVPADTVKTPCQARTNPSRTAPAVFSSLDVMACNWSF